VFSLTAAAPWPHRPTHWYSVLARCQLRIKQRSEIMKHFLIRVNRAAPLFATPLYALACLRRNPLPKAPGAPAPTFLYYTFASPLRVNPSALCCEERNYSTAFLINANQNRLFLKN
jgi:hypothetical protein